MGAAYPVRLFFPMVMVSQLVAAALGPRRPFFWSRGAPPAFRGASWRRVRFGDGDVGDASCPRGWAVLACTSRMAWRVRRHRSWADGRRPASLGARTTGPIQRRRPQKCGEPSGAPAPIRSWRRSREGGREVSLADECALGSDRKACASARFRRFRTLKERLVPSIALPPGGIS